MYKYTGSKKFRTSCILAFLVTFQAYYTMKYDTGTKEIRSNIFQNTIISVWVFPHLEINLTHTVQVDF